MRSANNEFSTIFESCYNGAYRDIFPPHKDGRHGRVDLTELAELTSYLN
jgi:hypothetical protein